ncbi:MAG: hypothetical protein WCO89_00885 [Syntrophus sp. (in: bacteria)]
MKRLMLALAVTFCLSVLTLAWAQEKRNSDAYTGRSIDILAYCRKAYGDSAGISHVRSLGNSWRCTLGKREYPVDMDAACKLQYDDTFSARLANPADSYTWSCNSRKAHSR